LSLPLKGHSFFILASFVITGNPHLTVSTEFGRRTAFHQ
jgi:hypothetical protein